MVYNAYTVEIASDPVARYWTGYGMLSKDGNEWAGGGEAVSVGGVQLLAGAPDQRSSFTLSGVGAEIRGAFLQDAGPLQVTIQWIHSADGVNWSDAPVRVRGRMSQPVIKEGAVNIEVETRKGDVDRGRPRKVSHEDQQARYPGDRGCEYMRQNAQVEYDTAWPP